MLDTTEQSPSALSVESPPGVTADPTSTTNKLEQAADQLNTNMETLSKFLERLSQRIPTGECSHEARETASHCLTGKNESDRKRHHSESFSADEEDENPPMKSHKV